MSCPTSLTGIARGCNDGVGGIKRVLAGLKDDFTITVEDGEITAINKTQTGNPMVEYLFRRNTASYTSTLTVDDAAGTSYWSTVLSLQFSKVEAAKRVAIQSLVNAEAVIIIELFTGEKILLGYDTPATCTAGTSVSGQAKGDMNGYTIEITDESAQLPYHLDNNKFDDAALDELKA